MDCPSSAKFDGRYCSASCRRIDALSARGTLIGSQQPTFLWVPTYTSTAGMEVIDLARGAGLDLDPWQQLLIMHAFAEDSAWSWMCFEVAIVVSRQNGKGSVLEAIELAWLFLFGEKLVMHSAHLFETSREHFLRIIQLIRNNPDFDRRVHKVKEGRGSEEIELVGGARLKFMTRKGGAGRGFSGSKIVIDECMYLDATMMAASLPTLATAHNAQVWYTGSAGFKTSTQLAYLRRRALTRSDPGLMYAEWSLDDPDRTEEDPEPDRSDPASHARTNPAMGIRISASYIAQEARSLGGYQSVAFGTERLGIGDYPADGQQWETISEDQWTACLDTTAALPADRPQVAFGLHADPTTGVGTIAAYGWTEGRRWGLIETVARHRGVDWMVDWLAGRKDAYRIVAVVLLGDGPVAGLTKRLRQARLPLHSPTAAQYTQGCMDLYTDIVERVAVRHLGQQSMDGAVAGARRIQSGRGAWTWDPHTVVDQGPLIGATLAKWGHDNPPARSTGWAVSHDELVDGAHELAGADRGVSRGSAGYARASRGDHV